MVTILVNKCFPANPQQTFTTIQEAINAASPGNTIIVSPGLYYEQITIDKPLTLLGAQACKNPVDGGRFGGESTIDSQFSVTIAASDIVFNGFEVRNFRYGINIPLASFTAPSYTVQNIDIEYNWIHSEVADVGFNAEPGLLRNLTIANNIIFVDGNTPYALAAIGFSSGATATPTYENVKINNNEITNLSDEYGLFAGADPGAYLINKMEINCNHFLNTPDGANLNIGNIFSGSFTNNVVEDVGGSIGIQYGKVSGNTFRNGGNISLWGTEFGFTRPSKYVDVFNNEFTDEVFGRALRIRPGALSYTIPVHYNAFQNSGITPTPFPDLSAGYIIRNEGIGTLDASLNWWGSRQGPSGNAGAVFGSVITSPWIKKYKEVCKKLRPPKCWPLSTFMVYNPGFWPIFVYDVEYIGNTCFDKCEYAVLEARVLYHGDHGCGIPVEFIICGQEYKTNTIEGGFAYVCFNQLNPGIYKVTINAGGYHDHQKIVVE